MAVAQLVESRIVIPVVVGSSPISHPKSIKHLAPLHKSGAFCFWAGTQVAKMGTCSCANSKKKEAVDEVRPVLDFAHMLRWLWRDQR